MYKNSLCNLVSFISDGQNIEMHDMSVSFYSVISDDEVKIIYKIITQQLHSYLLVYVLRKYLIFGDLSSFYLFLYLCVSICKYKQQRLRYILLTIYLCIVYTQLFQTSSLCLHVEVLSEVYIRPPAYFKPYSVCLSIRLRLDLIMS